MVSHKNLRYRAWVHIMKIIPWLDFGLDMAGRPAPELRSGVCWHVLASIIETIPYWILWQAIRRVLAHTVDMPAILASLVALA